MKTERFIYRGPVEQLAERLRRLERHRKHVLEELHSLQRFLNKNPDLQRVFRNTSAVPHLRLIVDNSTISRSQNP
jgi:hypothetical protein